MRAKEIEQRASERASEKTGEEREIEREGGRERARAQARERERSTCACKLTRTHTHARTHAHTETELLCRPSLCRELLSSLIHEAQRLRESSLTAICARARMFFFILFYTRG